MTGPEHYREAERLLALIEATPEDSVGSVTACATAAQVHATLALAAATALALPDGLPARDWGEWRDAAAETGDGKAGDSDA